MRNLLNKLLLFTLCTLSFSSCMDNDIPYPDVALYITELKGDGFTASIDDKNRIVTLSLEETTDIKNVNITSVSFTQDALCDTELIGTFDMRMPIEATLSLYDDYVWTITASQSIERYFAVTGQIGLCEVNESDRSISVSVAQSRNMDSIEVTSLKLGPEGISTYNPDNFIGIQSFNSVRRVTVSYHSDDYVWDLYVNKTDVSVDLSLCELWSKVAWLGASADLTSGSYGFRYKKESDADWSEVPSEDITSASGYFEAKIDNLDPETSYQFEAYAGSDTSPIITKTSEPEYQLPNSNMEGWSKTNGIYYIYAEGDNEFWASGNPNGYVQLAAPSTENYPGSTAGYSANLTPDYYMKFAAGNLFLGRYVETAGTNGIIAFGRPFTYRPQSLKVWVKYTCGKMDNISGTAPIDFDTSSDDIGSVYIALGTWTKEEYGYDSNGELKGTDDCPIIIDTRDSQTFFNSTSSAVIAYGEKTLGVNDSEWQQIEIPLVYNDYQTVPTHIVIACSSAKYGDYFTGSTTSEMWADDFELVY